MEGEKDRIRRYAVGLNTSESRIGQEVDVDSKAVTADGMAVRFTMIAAD